MGLTSTIDTAENADVVMIKFAPRGCAASASRIRGSAQATATGIPGQWRTCRPAVASRSTATGRAPVGTADRSQTTPRGPSAKASWSLDWGLGTLIPAASLVVSEFATTSTFHAGTHIALSVAWSRGALRLIVGDNSPEPPRQRFPQFDQHGRARSAVDGLNRAVGVLPTANGGKVVWAVLNAARPTP